MAVPRNDVGMYEVLDMVFEDNKQAPLYKYSKITRDAITGKKNTTYRYEVANEDQDILLKRNITTQQLIRKINLILIRSLKIK